MNENYDTLIKFGKSFQNKVVSCLITDGKFLSTVDEILYVDYFESTANKWIIGEIKNHFGKFKKPPTIDVFKVSLSSIVNEAEKQSIRDSLREAWEFRGSNDLEFVKETFTDFCRNQKMKLAIMNSVHLLEAGDYEQIRTEVDTALKAGHSDDLGYDYKLNVDARLDDETVRNAIATPWEVLNDLLMGGLGPGELGVVVAPTGGGKSWALAKIASDAIMKGLTVFHYTLELNDEYVSKRYDSIFTGFAAQKHGDNKEKIRETVKNLPGKLLVKVYPTKSASVRTLTSHIERSKTAGLSPDLIIVDYADLLRPSGRATDSKYEELGGIYEELRGMSGELEVPVWTASQVNRDGSDNEIISVKSIADSFAKAFVADFIFSISRRDKDKISNTARVHIVKNRLGSDGMTLQSSMNLANGQIEIYAPNSSDSIMTEKSSKNAASVERQGLSKKYSELM